MSLVYNDRVISTQDRSYQNPKNGLLVHKGSNQDKGVTRRQRIGHEDAGGSQQNVSGRGRIHEAVGVREGGMEGEEMVTLMYA